MSARYESQIRGKIVADEVHIGQGVIVEEGVLITRKRGLHAKWYWAISALSVAKPGS